MENRESIRNRIVHYTRIVWDNNETGNMNPLTGMLVEELCNELYLLDNRLSNVDSTILNRLSRLLAPTQFAYIRPAHAILQVRPGEKHFQADKYTAFFLKEMPEELENSQVSSVAFTPVTNIQLNDITITHQLSGQSLWAVNDQGEKTLITHILKPAGYNTLWLRIEANDGIRQLKDLLFYIDFPHLDSNHEYYSLMDYTRWALHGNPIKAEQGIPLRTKGQTDNTEQGILDYYKSHFYALDILERDILHNETIPEELQGILNPEVLSELGGGCWLSLTFPPHFDMADILRARVILNTFPVVNRLYNEYVQETSGQVALFTLPSEIGEEFLSIATITDQSDALYCLQEDTKNKKGEYTLEAVKKKAVEDTRIADYLERLIDMVQNEQSAFPGIDSDRIQAVQDLVSGLMDNTTFRVEENRLNEYADVAKLQVFTHEKTERLLVKYWTTLSERANGLVTGTCMMALSVPALNKSSAILVTDSWGARSFYDMESLQAINRFYLTSRDRILTKQDILNYCYIEVGKYVTDVNVEKKVKISKRFKEGLINVMEIQLAPQKEYIEYIKQGGVVKELLLRLQQRSPDSYRYTIRI